MAVEEIIIDIKITDVYDQLKATTDEIDRLKASNQELTKRIKDGEDASGKYAKRLQENKIDIKDLTSTAKGYETQILNEIKANKAAEGSLVQLRAQLSNNTKAYDALSQAERTGAKGTALLSKIQLTTENLRLAEEESGRFQRSVGNYPQVFDLSGTALGRLQGIVEQFGGTASSTGNIAGNAFGAIKTQAISLGKAFLTPPIGLIVIVLSAIMLAVQKLVQAFKKNDEASTRLARAFAVLKPIGTLIGKLFDSLANSISLFVEGLALGFGYITKFAEALGLLPDGFTEAAEEAQKLVQAQDDLEAAERNYTVNSAKRNAEVAKLRDAAINKERYTAEQREIFLKKAIDLEKANLEDEKKIAAESLRILIATAKEENDTSDETANKIAAARAKMYQAEESYYTGTRKLNKQLQEARKEQQAEQEEIEKQNQEREKERLEKQKVRAANSLKIQQELQDAVIKSQKQGIEQQIAEEQLATSRKIAELRKQTDLTKQGLKDRDKLIIETQKISDAKVLQLQKQASEDSLKAAYDLEQKKIQILLDGATQGSKEALDLQVKFLESQRINAISDTTLTAEEVIAINAKFRNQEQAAVDAFEQAAAEKQLELLQTNLDNKLAVVQAGSDAELALKIEALNQEQAAEIAAAEKTGADVALINAKYNKLKKDADAAAQAAQLDALGQTIGQAAGLFEANTIAYKGLASAEALINTYQAATAALASGSKISPIFGTISAGIAIATGLKSVAKINNLKFESGGVVPGTSFVGDKVPISVNSGEMILNKSQQENLFKTLQNTPSGGFDYGALASAMANVRPIVSVSEINSVNSRVDVLDNLSNY